MISPWIREDIDLKMKKINRSPKTYGLRRELVLKELRELGDVYTFFIENPELRRELLHVDEVPESYKGKARDGIRRVKNAWNYLSERNSLGNGLIGVLEPKIVIGTNALVNGVPAARGDYRKGNVTISSPGYTPPSPEKLPGEVEKILAGMRDLHRKDVLESAIYGHLSLAVLQAFNDGNKRTARLIQDRILLDSGLPPAIIPAGEGSFYLDLVRGTAAAHHFGCSEGQEEFYNYIASKVNNGLDKILGDLASE